MNEATDISNNASSVTGLTTLGGSVSTGKVTVNDADADGSCIEIYYEVHTLRSR